jgi:glycosyltransferase involved in cell wall biosynthesis
MLLFVRFEHVDLATNKVEGPMKASLARKLEPELTIVMPCLNEARTVGTCVTKAFSYLKSHNINGEVVVADNGSTDGSQEIARKLGARVVAVLSRGYGNALCAGIDAARGQFVIMGDSDDSYDFSNLQPFVDKLRLGSDLVLGNRFLGGIAPGAMPQLHKFFGNPLLTLIGRTLFKSPSHDFYCGLRGFRLDGVVRLASPADRGNLLGMTMSQNPYRGFRFPAEVIQHAVWLYHCFSLSLRDVELILAARGIVVSYESIREGACALVGSSTTC